MKFTLLLLFVLIVIVDSFCPPLRERDFVSACLKLHPDQAHELEACAYDHWKELAEKSMAKELPERREIPAFAWCRNLFMAEKNGKRKATP
eukprot:CAMPEP_0116554604 /NCGR_PEP_ID=MMETSP0397-20121206/7686_1 /TAXON_ID=216820 /ORGANISM="Cyclophora tenuis, Strain ECT3854" /LENGTH=90 /DNA_ID=CAMNT_0004079787 /DNA_START=42 /DNA_END=314 /DNA_ORIENTATION=+